MGVKENKRADNAAKIVAEKRVIGECPERFTSLAHIRRSFIEKK